MSGTLYVVGTPIGNLEDITLRALRVLKEVHAVAAEDTRHTRKLMQHYDIHTPLLSYHEHNERDKAAVLIERLQAGEDLALVVDAGMPAVSDPGFHLVRAAVEAGISVLAVPGPSAVITALVVSGLPPDRFVFEGFLPRKGTERRQALERVAAESRTVVLYEAPHRLLQTLGDLADAVASRPVAVCRELTKRYEEVRRGTAAALRDHFRTHPPRGEFVVVIGGRKEPAPGDVGDEIKTAAIESLVAELEAAGLDHKAALREAAGRLRLSRRQVYERLHKKSAPQP